MNWNLFKEEIQNGDTVIGPFIRLREPALIEMLGLAGFDFAIIDLEHGPMDVIHAEDIVRTAKGVGIAPLVRVRRNDETMIQRALDVGSAGVQVPQVNSAKMAEFAIQSAKFYPQGCRGVCKFTRAAEYSNIESSRYFKEANEDTIVVLQIEGLGGVKEIDSILEKEGLDVLFLGPYDLSQALNVTGQVSHPDVLKTIERITKKAIDKGVAVGSFAASIENIKRQKDMGITFLSTYIDTGLFYETAKEKVSELKDLIKN